MYRRRWLAQLLRHFLYLPGGNSVSHVNLSWEEMAKEPSLTSHDRAGRLFLQALGTGSHGFFAAYRVVQIFPGPFPWDRLLGDLCMTVPSEDGVTRRLSLKPKLFQMPIQLQRNFLSLLNVLYSQLPAQGVHLLSEAVRTEGHLSDCWLQRLTHQLLQKSHPEICIQSAPVRERLQILFRGSNQTGAKSKLGLDQPHWDSSQTDCRMLCESETPVDAAVGSTFNIFSKEPCATPSFHNSEEELRQDVAPTTEAEEVPAFIKGNIANLKQIFHLEIQSETLDQEYVLQLRSVCDACTPLQLHAVFSSVGVAQMSPKCLFQLCCHLDLISPDLSYSHAESLANILFLEQVLSLSAPASRTLTAALTVFCKKYAWPACNALISSLLTKAETGSVYADFLCRMISECLESHELHLCFDPIFKLPCSEVSVQVLHLLVERKEKLNQSEFDLLLNHLGDAAENFAKSVTFSKFFLVLLTSKKNLVQLSHIELLTHLINSNQTFMKKSLQNALHKVQESMT